MNNRPPIFAKLVKEVDDLVCLNQLLLRYLQYTKSIKKDEVDEADYKRLLADINNAISNQNYFI
jgi:hypothetical protein